MTQRLNLKITLGSRQKQYPLDYNLEDSEAKISINTILKLINRFLSEHHYIVANYLNIWVVTNNGKENLYKLRRNSSYINLTLNQNSIFEIKIVLDDIQDKQNLLKFFHSNSEQFTRLSNNINRIIQQSKEEEKRGQKCVRPIDIAYFFADPLVTVSQKNKITINHEVSYQLEYDKFIELVKKEEFEKNFRIEMMVATKTNIKNTLFDGASILHFACHGKKPTGNLQIQSQTSIGELLNLEHQQFMNLLDIRTALPKLIIFNVCYSHTLANKVSSSKSIICIGYNDEASDVYCERFTREFYMGLFKRRESVRQLFHKIKNQIIEDDEKQGKKLCIFPQEPFPNQESEDFFGNSEYKLNYIKRWTPSQGLRENDCLGVKSEMFTFIKQYLTNSERISYFFLKGEKLSGKSDFMKKTRIYIMDRKVFTQDFTVDLKDKDGSYIETLLQLRLDKEDMINKKMNELKQLSKERKTNPIIIFDHSQKILKIQYSKFVEFIQNKFMKQLRYGKIVIITNNITPIIQEEAENFKKAYFHLKEPPNIQPKELENYISRYASEDVKEPAFKYCMGRYYPYLKLVKAIKRSKSQQQLAENCQSQEPVLLTKHSFQSINLQYIQYQIKQFQRSIQQIHECATIKIQDNDHIFLSTILLEVNLEEAQHYTSLSCIRNNISEMIQQVTNKFTVFIKSIFKVYKHQQRLFNQMKHKIPMKMLFHLSFKIAAFIYIFKDFRLFEKQLLNCEKLYVLISGFFLQDLKRQNEFQELVTQYHLKLLLTLYSYYSENEYFLKNKSLADERTNQQKQSESIFHRKAEIIMDEILTNFDRNQYQYLLHTLKNVFLINDMVQQLHYNKNYNLFVQNQHKIRRESEIFDLSNDDGVDLQEQAALIDQHHEKIITYWKTFLQIEKYSRHDNWSILRRESILLMEIAVLKHIVYNLRQFDVIFEKGESFLNENVGLYINYYIVIMQKIHNDGIFSDKERNSLFHHHTSEAVKPLFQEYLKAFIETYFNLSKIKQNLNKEYNLPIFYELISLCEKSHYISGISSIKKMIELHINEQFFNTWTCTSFIALPLTYERAGADVKYNIKRFENHIYNFLQNFYQNELDKQVKFEVKLMSEENLRHYEKEKRHLIQLIICDCTEESEKVYLQSETGRSVPCNIRALPLPNAPIIIYFGANVKNIQQVYNKKKSIAIWINIDQKDKDRECFLEKQRNLGNIQAVNNLLGVYYNVLEYFYCSFCRHFFNGTHELFTQQVKNSFQLAKAETIIKTKILYSTHKQFHNQREIQHAIDQIDCNLQYLISSNYGQELLRKPAYHFIYKQSKNEKPQTKNLYQIRNRTWQLGCNYEICELLMQLGQIKFQRLREVNIIIYYKSQPMMSFFLNTLKIKLLKIGGYIKNKEITRQEYNEYRNSMNNQLSRSSLNQIQEYLDDDTFFITPFVNLEETQFSAELCSLNVVKNTTIKLFFTRSKYSNLSKVYRKLSIEEHYKTNKVEFDYYFLYCRTLRPNASQKKIIQIYKELPNQSWSLLDVKTAIQRL